MRRENRMDGAAIKAAMKSPRATTARITRGALSVRIVRMSDSATTRVGFITPAKRVGNAVARNSVRRALRVEADRLVERIPQGYHVVAFALGTPEDVASAVSGASLADLVAQAARRL